MSDGSAVVITLGKLLACDGISFEGVGVSVDVERALTTEEQTMQYDFTTETDPQILRALEVADSLTGTATVGEAENNASSSASSDAGEADDSMAADAASSDADSSDSE